MINCIFSILRRILDRSRNRKPGQYEINVSMHRVGRDLYLFRLAGQMKTQGIIEKFSTDPVSGKLSIRIRKQWKTVTDLKTLNNLVK